MNIFLQLTLHWPIMKKSIASKKLKKYRESQLRKKFEFFSQLTFSVKLLSF